MSLLSLDIYDFYASHNVVLKWVLAPGEKNGGKHDYHLASEITFIHHRELVDKKPLHAGRPSATQFQR